VQNDVLERFADLIVAFGANVQAGQIVAVSSEPGKEMLTRAIAASAYRHEARFVDVQYFDVHVKRARIAYAPDDTLDFVPSWLGERLLALGDQHCARIALSGPVAPGLFADLDPVRAGRDMLPFLKEASQLIDRSLTNWTIAPCPTPAWAQLVHPDLEPDAALERLWEQVIHVCRLDEDDPVAVWQQRIDQVRGAARRLNERRFDALHYEGPGTDLTIGLLPISRWDGAVLRTAEGIEHFPNIPSEEVFTSPDPTRVDGVVRSTKPLVVLGGTTIENLVVRFEGGRAVGIDADAGAETLRTLCERDQGASRLGEVALVDGAGRIGPLETTFYDTLLDENAASHIALGNSVVFGIDDEDRKLLNRSDIHIDFMIGSDEVSVTGITEAGERVPVLIAGEWKI